MSKSVIVRGKVLNADFAKTVSKKRFCEIYADMKPKVVEAGWNELLEVTGRTSKPEPKPERKRKGKRPTS